MYHFALMHQDDYHYMHQDDYHYTGYIAFCLAISRGIRGTRWGVEVGSCRGSTGTGTKEINEVIYV